MKKLIALSGLLFIATAAKADFCRTEMVDYMGNVRLIITQAQPNYLDPYCYWGYQQCVASIHLNPTMRPSCRVMRIVNQPTYNPYQQPNPTPSPRPPRPQWNPGDDGRPTTSTSTSTTNSNRPPRAGSSSGRVQPPAGNRTPAPAPTRPTRPSWNEGDPLRSSQPRIEVDASSLRGGRTVLTANGEETVVETFDGQRSVEVGETVYMFGKSYTVVSASGNEYDIQPEGSRRKKDIVRVGRDKIAIARGCSLNICVTDPVFNISKGKMEAVAGLTITGELVTKSSDNGRLNQQPVQLREIALGKGCVSNRSKQEICVGNTIQANDGRYFDIVAVQHDGKVVVKTEGRNPAYYPNVDAGDFIVIR